MFVKAKTLTEKGFPASTIRQFCHMEGSPFFQKAPGGTWWCSEEKFDKWVDKLARNKEVFI